MKRLLLTTVAIFSALFLSASNDEIDSLVNKLDQALSMKQTYDSYFFSKIDHLQKMQWNETSLKDTQILNFRIANEYSHHSLDSTLSYIDRNMEIARRIGDKVLEERSDLYRAYFYASAGYYIEAGNILGSYRPEELCRESFLAYSSAMVNLITELKVYSMTENVPDKDISEYRDYLLKHCEENTYEWHDLMRASMESAGDVHEERKHIKAMLALANEGTNEYARACYYYSTTCEEHSDEKLSWLIRSSISDVMSSTLDYQSLISVAQELFERGDVKRAFKYMADYCLPDAISYNGKLRPLQIAHFFPEMEHAYQDLLDKQDRIKMNYMILLFILLTVLATLTAVIFFRQQILVRTRNELQMSNEEIEMQNMELTAMNAKLKGLNLRMKEADKVKEEYISLFLSILSENISTVRQYKNHVLKNLRQGNYKHLLEEIEALPPIDEDINEFYKMFDQTFINMYPDFVERFNTLLMEGEEVYPKGDDLLAPDLRIFALIKLGITDSSKIASLLHYSTNTIYNYKARIKNKAKGNREKFEDDVRNLYTEK